MNLDVISQVIVTAGLAKGLGTDLFQHHMPDGCNAGILLKEPLQGTEINHYIPGFFKGPLQVIVRSQTPDETLANALLSALNLYNQTYNDGSGALLMMINYMRARTLPVFYPRTPGNTFEWSIMFDACYVLPVQFS